MTTTLSSHANVVTDKPVAYMRQLCKHFGHKIDASFDDDSGYIQFETGRCELDATASDRLGLTVTAETADALERMENVVASHLERFGHGDLTVTWGE